MKLSMLAKEAVALFRAQKTIMLIGPPGSAKSAFVTGPIRENIATYMGGPVAVITCLLTQRSAQELLGYMVPTKDAQGRAVAVYTLSAIQAAIEAAYASGAKAVILFLDEFLQAQHPEQKAASEVIYDRRLGEFKFPDTVMVICASNRPADGAGVLKALRHNNNRVCKYDIQLDHDAYLTYLREQRIVHPVFVACAAKMPEIFVQTLPGGAEADDQFCTFRSYYDAVVQWAYLSGYVDTGDTSAPLRTDEFALESFAGFVGWPAARKVFAFTSMHDLVPSIEEIKRDPATAKLPPHERIDAHYYATQLVCHHANDNGGRDIDLLFTYLERLRPALLTAAITQLMAKPDTSFLQHGKKLAEWLRNNSQLVGASMRW